MSNNLLSSFQQAPLKTIGRIGREWLADQSLLVESFLVAISIHVLLVPVVWVLGWTLPWPKEPAVTTVVEYDLRNWPNVLKSKKILEFRNPEFNQ